MVRLIKSIFYVAMIIGCALVIKEVSSPGSGECDYMTFTMLSSIFYWFYRLIKLALSKLNEDEEEYLRARERKYYKDSWDNEAYHRKYQPKGETYQNKVPADEKDESLKRIEESIKVRSDIKILEIKR